MAPLVLALSIIFTLFATAILAYVSMISMIGPWLAPSIALLGSFVIRKIYPKSSNHATQYHVAILQAIAAGGGTIAVGVGFALPMLYFLDPAFFTESLQRPELFVLFVGITVLCAGALGIFLARRFVECLIFNQKLPFPSSRLTFNVIQAQGESCFTGVFASGFSIAGVICFLRDGIRSFSGIIPKVIHLFGFMGHDFSCSISPMLWAIGFSVGMTIAFPLAVGVFSKIFLFPFVQYGFWILGLVEPPSLSSIAMGFCSGLMLAGVIGGLRFSDFGKKFSFFTQFGSCVRSQFEAGIAPHYKTMASIDWRSWRPDVLIALLSLVLLLCSGFNVAAALLFLLLTGIATYHICLMSGHIGMVQFGRFSTFIMIPMLLTFSLSAVQVTLICLFFHICAASASDYLFDYNIFHLGNYSKKNLIVYQFIGLIITALSLGFILWLLFTNFQLGSPDLFAQRAKAKALLIQSLSFDYPSLFFGFLYGMMMKFFRINPTMVLGGVLMPPSLVVSLLGGAVVSAFVRKERAKEVATPFCAGILAGESLWVISSILLRAR